MQEDRVTKCSCGCGANYIKMVCSFCGEIHVFRDKVGGEMPYCTLCNLIHYPSCRNIQAHLQAHLQAEITNMKQSYCGRENCQDGSCKYHNPTGGSGRGGAGDDGKQRVLEYLEDARRLLGEGAEITQLQTILVALMIQIEAHDRKRP